MQVTSNIHVQFAGVSKSYDGRTLIVDDLNLEIEKGEFLTLLGPSGSGKSTCLMMLAGFEPLSGGDILVDQVSVGYLEPQKRNIGMVFQSYALFPHMSVADNIAFPLKARGRPKAEIREKVAGALGMIQMDHMKDRMPGQLSGGQQQRVALARALVFEPSLVLMDEPLGALDKQLREEMQYEIMHIQKRLGVTVVYVTHDQTEALTMSDRIAVFNGGRIQQLARPEVLYQNPQNAFVASFIGENNSVPGTVLSLKGSECRVRVGTDEIMAHPVGDIAESKPVALSLRPERVVLGSRAQAADNRFDAVVTEVIFHGDHQRVVLDVLGQSGFVVKVPNSAGFEPPEVGKAVSVGWTIKDCHALAPIGGSTA
ncbi:MAG: ABC transporter ATP-binding protein [Nitratireductor sp.]|nr:ABC transporter ATP-binding protein [Nitratireductor sp.]